MKKSFFVLLGLTCLSFLIYARTLDYPFAFDDHHVITENRWLHHLADVPRLFVSFHMESGEKTSTSFRPFLYATYALNYALSGINPWSYRLFDILSHALCSFLVYLISLIIIRERGDGHTWPAAAMAVIFCVHPAQTESVIYVSARSAQLVCTLFMASVYFYLKARTCNRSPGGSSRIGPTGWTVLSFIALALALLTKETAAALLPFFFVLEYYFRKKKGGVSLRFLVAATAMTVVYTVYRLYLVAGSSKGVKMDYIGHWAGWISRFPSYIRLLLVPFSESIEHPMADKISSV
ncbi:MAG: ArnT family glycosyltransferase, partial [Nitrospirota bacterium]